MKKNNYYQNYFGAYTKPSLVTCSKNLQKKWFVQFMWHDRENNEKKRIQIKHDINKWTTLKDRLQYGKDFTYYITDKLQRDWNPLTNEFYHKPKNSYQTWADKDICSAMNDAINVINLAPDSMKGYRLAVKYFNHAAKKIKLEQTEVSKIKRSMIIQILDAYADTRKASNVQYNKNLGYLHAIFQKVVLYADLLGNPFTGIPKKAVVESKGFIRPTDQEQKEIRDYLLENDLNFLRFILVIYHTGMRPAEILKLKIKDIDLINNYIYIYPNLELRNSKTKKIRKVPMNSHLCKFIESMNLQNYDTEYYLFGSPAVSGRGNTGISKVEKQTYFMPNKTKIGRDFATRLWNKYVKKELDLKCDMYGLKHKGGDDKLLAGISLDSLRELYGHSSKQMTMKYVSKLYEIHAKEILEKSPAF